jgi:hypothetical protein
MSSLFPTSLEWICHFEHRRASRPELAWARGVTLTIEEARAVAKSIAVFQRGESGEGRHLLRVAREHAERGGDAAYVVALELFIREERCHAALLQRYLTAADLPLLTRDWTDGVFRWLRHQAGLELSISVLVTAEVLAMVYYAALRRATGCRLLKELCVQVLEDEVFHLQFQGQRLGILAQGRSPWAFWLTNASRNLLLGGTAIVLWLTHHAVFRSARLPFARYWRRVWRHAGFLNSAMHAAAVPACSPRHGDKLDAAVHSAVVLGACNAGKPTTG